MLRPRNGAQSVSDALEIAVLMSVKHPGVVRVYSCLTDAVESAPSGEGTPWGWEFTLGWFMLDSPGVKLVYLGVSQQRVPFVASAGCGLMDACSIEQTSARVVRNPRIRCMLFGYGRGFEGSG